MEVRTETKITSVTLTMDQQEAEWLKCVMQNPFCEDCGREDEETMEMRERFFYALKGEMEIVEEKYEAPKREARPCKCGESDQKNLVFVSLLSSEWDVCRGGTERYEHFVQCQTCKKRGPSVYSSSSSAPAETLDRWGLK